MAGGERDCGLSVREVAVYALDRLATDFLTAHDCFIDAEPQRQYFRWVRYSEVPRTLNLNRGYVPVSSFFDLPRAITGPFSKWRCLVCGNALSISSSSNRCNRCYKKKVRANFISRWREKATDRAFLAAPMEMAIAWGESTGERTWVSPVATEEEISSSLRDEFALAMERNAEPETFREIVARYGFDEWLETRDQARAEAEFRRRENVRRARTRSDEHVNEMIELFASGKSVEEVRAITGFAKSTLATYNRLGYRRRGYREQGLLGPYEKE